MSCYSFCHDNTYGGSAYVSGTTCDGVVGAFTLNLGACICLDTTNPHTCCGPLIFSAICLPFITPTATPTNTITPTITPTNTGTPTATPTPTQGQCREYTASKNSTFLSVSNIDYTDCYGVPQSVTLENPPNTYPESITFCAIAGTLSFDPIEITVVENGSCLPVTQTPTNTSTQTPTVTPTPSVTIGLTPTQTSSNTPTPSNTATITPTTTQTPTNTPTNTQTPTNTPTTTNTPTNTQTTTQTSSPTNTQTPTNTPTTTYEPICPEQLLLTAGLEGYSAMTGTYDRLYSYTGGSFNTIWYESTLANRGWKYNIPDSVGNYAVAYGRFDGSLYYTIYGESNTNPSVIDRWILFTGTTNNGIGPNRSGANYVISNNSENISTILYPARGLQNNQFYIAYPLVCPTPTPTNSPTTTSTPTNTPTNTQTPTTTPTNTPTISSTPNPVCPEELNFQDVVDPYLFISGNYTRLRTYTGGTMEVGYYDTAPNEFIAGPDPNGKSYSVFYIQSGSTYSQLLFYRNNVSNTDIGYVVCTTTGTTVPQGAICQSSSLIVGNNAILSNGIYYPQQGIFNEGTITYPLACSTPTPTPTVTSTQTQTPSNTPTLTPTNTKTPTPTPTPTSTPPQEFCNYPTISSQNSLDIQITDVQISGVSVSYISGTTFPIADGDPSGFFGSNISGSSVTLDVYYTSSISGQNITVSDCDEIIHCCNTNTGSNVCSFTIDLSCGCAWTITASDGACS